MLLIPASYSYPNYPYHQSLSYCLNISVQSFSYFVVPLLSANTSGALSYKVLGFCYITAANCQYPDPHKMIFSSLLMKMQLTGENISQNSLKYLFLFLFLLPVQFTNCFHPLDMNKKSKAEAPGVLYISVFVSVKQMSSSFQDIRWNIQYTGMYFSSLCFNGSLKRRVKKFARDYRSVFNGKGNHHASFFCHGLHCHSGHLLESTGVQSLWKLQTKQSAPSAGRMCTF